MEACGGLLPAVLHVAARIGSPAPQPPPTPAVSMLEERQRRIAEEMAAQFAQEAAGAKAAQQVVVKAMPTRPQAKQAAAREPRSSSIPAQIRSPARASRFPHLPRRPALGATPAELARHEQEYRRIAYYRRMLCSEAWCRHADAVIRPAATSVILPEALQPLAVA